MIDLEKSKRMQLILGIAGIVLIIAFVAALIWRHEINNSAVLRSYRVSADIEAGEATEAFVRLCKEKDGIKLKRAKNKSHLFLKLGVSRKYAEEVGFPLDAYDDNGYLITLHGNTLFLLSPSEAGLIRAEWYLLTKLIDKDGNLLIGLGETVKDYGTEFISEIRFGEQPLNEFCLSYSEQAKDAAYELLFYINDTTQCVPVVNNRMSGAANLTLSVDDSLPAGTGYTTLQVDRINLVGADEKALLNEVYKFANSYLSWEHAGTESEKKYCSTKVVYVSQDSFEGKEAWISEREPIITLWNTNFSRGIFLNESTSLKTDVMSMSDEQLYEYVRMFKFCGYTGIQVTDMCAAWAGAGGYELVHERLKLMANAAHEMGMNFTLWVWGSEFTGYGWVDNTVTYDKGKYDFAYQNPDVISSFDKYYGIYTEMAEYCDRVISHYYDPGNLSMSEDIGFFGNRLKLMMQAKNPSIDFGISCWGNKFEKSKLLAALGADVTVYEGTNSENVSLTNEFRTYCNNAGWRLGTWSWNNCEMEIDQLAQMNFNPHRIKETYDYAMQSDSIMKPSYWSEMDSNHVINVFSHYCAGKMLIDPTLSPEEVTIEVAHMAVGSRYAADFAEVLTLIEDARTGHSIDTAIWASDNYIVKSDNYPAKDLKSRSEKAIKTLNKMIDAGVESYMLPLPISFTDVCKLILPHVLQIKEYCEFRIAFDEIKSASLEDLDEEQLEEKLAEIAKPVSEYNTVIGLWGQVEARTQQELLYEFCAENEIEMPEDPSFKRAQKNRIYDYFVSYQKGKKTPVINYAPYYQYGYAYGEEYTIALVEEMIEEGIFTKDEATGGVYLTDWEHYKYAFN